MSEVFELNPVQGISYKSSQDGQDMCGELLADAGDGKRYEKKHEWMELEEYAETEWLNMVQLCWILLRESHQNSKWSAFWRVHWIVGDRMPTNIRLNIALFDFCWQMYGDFSGSGGFGWAAKVGRCPDFDDFLGKDIPDGGMDGQKGGWTEDLIKWICRCLPDSV